MSLSPKDWLLSGACLAAVLSLSFAGFQAWRADRLKADRDEARAAAETQTKQAGLNGEAVKVIDRTHIITQRIEETAHVEAGEVRAAVGGDTPIPADVARAWAFGVRRVRAASEPATDDPGSGEPSGSLPESEP